MWATIAVVLLCAQCRAIRQALRIALPLPDAPTRSPSCISLPSLMAMHTRLGAVQFSDTDSRIPAFWEVNHQPDLLPEGLLQVHSFQKAVELAKACSIQ